MIYFDNAATTYPKPRSVIHSVYRSFEIFGANPSRGSYKMSMDTSKMIYDTRCELCKFFGIDSPENIIFTYNATMSLNLVINGLMGENDHIICSPVEHNAVARVVCNYDYDIFDYHPDNISLTIQSIKNLIKPNTKVLVCTAVSNVFGFSLPIEEIGALCKKMGIIFVVDGAAAVGYLSLDISNIDFLCFSGHKGLFSPLGIGVIVINSHTLLKPTIFGGTGTDSENMNMPSTYPDRLEAGTPNTHAICGLYYGLKFLKRKSRIYEYNMICYLYDRLLNIPNVILYTERPVFNRHSPILSFNIKDMDSEIVGQILAQNNICVRCGLHCAPLAHAFMGTLNSGTVRVSLSLMNRKYELDYFLNVVQKIASGHFSQAGF